MATVAVVTEQDGAGRALQLSVRGWFIATLLGQAMFLFYILGFYTPPAVTGTFERWSQNREVIDAYVAGDVMGNVQFGLHVLAAAILTLGGILQLWPSLRARARRLHRWNGRIFMVTALFAALGGLWLVWVRGSRLDMASAVAVSLNGVLILWFAVAAWRAARARQFAAHEQWAVRAFFAVSGVWCLRVGMMAYALIGVGGLGLPRETAMTFFAIWGFGSYLVPLAIYEFYLRAKASGSAGRRLAAGVVGLSAVLVLVGSMGAGMVMWLPPLRASGLFG
jgi:hypothetical protein